MRMHSLNIFFSAILLLDVCHFSKAATDYKEEDIATLNPDIRQHSLRDDASLVDNNTAGSGGAQLRGSSRETQSISSIIAHPLKTNGLCATPETSSRSNGVKVVLRRCNNHPEHSGHNTDVRSFLEQQWDRDSLGRLVNRLTGKCLEAGVRDVLYAKAYSWDCHLGEHQRWHKLSNGKYKNKKYNKYLGVAYCGDRSKTGYLELRNAEGKPGGACNCSQRWNRNCVVTPTFAGLQTNGLCAAPETSSSANGVRVVLKHCETFLGSGPFTDSRPFLVQQWDRDSLGRLVNRLTNKCLEAGGGDVLYAKAYSWDCHLGEHQRWHKLSNGKYKNKKYNKYLGVAYCGDRSKTGYLELRNSESGGACNCSQTWNKSCTS